MALTGLTSLARRELGGTTSLDRVEEVFEWAIRRQLENRFYTDSFLPSVKEIIRKRGRHIDNVICFELGTIEADIQSDWTRHTGQLACSAHHLFAVAIRDYIAQNFETRVGLIFQHLEYTDATASYLGQIFQARVIRDNISGFQCITQNSLVIWMARDGPMPIPVKQIIADFPYQISPRPLPSIMIWPEERYAPTTMNAVMAVRERDHDTGR